MVTLHIIYLLLLIFTLLILLFLFYAQKTKTKHLKRQLEFIQGESEEEMYGKGKFSELGLLSAGITHEISNPLTSILGRSTQLLRSNNLSKEDKKAIEQIKIGAERIGKIIQSVREYIYQNGDISEDFIPLSEIINDVLVFYRQRLKNHNIELRIKNIENIYVSGHKIQFEQALLNLLSNSFDAVDSLEEKWIEISTKKTQDNVQIFVKDSGHGIPIEVRTKMLEPFYTTKKGKGFGLGLTLVRDIAQKHGGDLKYIEGNNTTFMLELPKSTGTLYHH